MNILIMKKIVNETKVELKRVAKEFRKYDSDKKGQRNFAVGEQVLVKKEPHNIHKRGDRYEGPYAII